LQRRREKKEKSLSIAMAAFETDKGQALHVIPIRWVTVLLRVLVVRGEVLRIKRGKKKGREGVWLQA